MDGIEAALRLTLGLGLEGKELGAGQMALRAVVVYVATVLMVRLGKTYAGLMVDMRASNAKLRVRSINMVARITGVSPEAAAQAVADADGEVKLAALIARGMTRETAAALLAKHDGNLRLALADAQS